MLHTTCLLFVLGAPAHGESIYLPPNLYLVHARTVAVGRREVSGPRPRVTIPEARFEITRVYLGPDWLKKYSFSCDQVPYQITVTSPLDRLQVNVGFQKGAEGLWWVSYDSAKDGSLHPVRQAGVVDALGIRPFPYQKMPGASRGQPEKGTNGEQLFREGLAWAEAAEKVYRAKSDQERATLLKEYAAEHAPRSAWAIACLAHARQKELAPFFRKLLADEKMPLASQVVLDGALLTVDPSGWEKAKERTALYQRWRETYRGSVLPLPLEVLDAQRMQRREPPLFLRPGGGLP